MKNIEIRDLRLAGGRLSVEPRTDDSLVYALRKRTLRALIEYGADGLALIERVRNRSDPLRVDDLDGLLVRGQLDGRRVQELLIPAEEKGGEEEPAPVAVPPMLAASVDRFLRKIEADSAEGTLRAYRSVLTDLERYAGVVRGPEREIIRDVPVPGLTTTAWGEGWIKEKKSTTGGRSWSARQQRKAIAAARQVWEIAIVEDEERAERDGLPRTLEHNLWGKGRRKVGRPKVRRTRFAYLKRPEAARLLWRVRGTPVAAYIAAGIYGGLRPDEKRHLRPGIDVDFDRLEIHVQSRGGEYAWKPKAERSEASVPMNPQLVRWMRAHIRFGYAGVRYFFRTPGQDRPMSDFTSARWIREAFTTVGLKYGGKKGDALSDHSLRHTCGSWLAQDDVQLMKLAEHLRISTKVAEEHYIHLIPQNRRETANRLASGRRFRRQGGGA